MPHQWGGATPAYGHADTTGLSKRRLLRPHKTGPRISAPQVPSYALSTDGCARFQGVTEHARRGRRPALPIGSGQACRYHDRPFAKAGSANRRSAADQLLRSAQASARARGQYSFCANAAARTASPNAVAPPGCAQRPSRRMCPYLAGAPAEHPGPAPASASPDNPHGPPPCRAQTASPPVFLPPADPHPGTAPQSRATAGHKPTARWESSLCLAAGWCDLRRSASNNKSFARHDAPCPDHAPPVCRH